MADSNTAERPVRWQDEFAKWLAGRPDMQQAGSIEQLEECLRERPDIGDITNAG